MTADQYRQHLNEESGQFVTAGIRAESDASGYLLVTEVYAGSSAESMRIMRGDIITSVGGRNVLTLGANSALRQLDGEENTRLELSIQREGEVIEHSLIRQATDIISVEDDVINGIGFMRISTFNALTESQFNAALQTFAEANVRALLIDVRDNRSNYFTPVSSMVNSLIGAGTIARTEHRGGGVRDFIVTDDSRAFPESMQNIPIIVLTNAQTSGAGELLAAILRNHINAQIVGTGTAGNTFRQEIQPLSDGSAIRVTVAKITLTDAPDFSGTGLTPDFTEEMNAEISYVIAELRDRELSEIADIQIRRAFEIINTA
jgi:carboxyl-terminal processing protease